MGCKSSHNNIKQVVYMVEYRKDYQSGYRGPFDSKEKAQECLANLQDMTIKNGRIWVFGKIVNKEIK